MALLLLGKRFATVVIIKVMAVVFVSQPAPVGAEVMRLVLRSWYGRVQSGVEHVLATWRPLPVHLSKTVRERGASDSELGAARLGEKFRTRRTHAK